MNIQRRKAIDALRITIENARNELEDLKDEEQEYADNMPENMQFNSEKHERAEEVVNELDTAISITCHGCSSALSAANL